MRQPASPLPPVDAERLEPPHEVTCELVGPTAAGVAWNELFGQSEHGDPSRLAIPAYPQDRLTSIAGDAPECACDRVDVGRGTAAEKGERDVEVVRRKDAHVGVGKHRLLPGDEERDDVGW